MSKKEFSKVPVAIGDEIELTIDDIAYGGDGVGKYQNFAIFVPRGIPGDKLIVIVEKIKKHFAFGQIKKVIKDSPLYTLPVCPDFKMCGGCQWLNIKYPHQLEFKTNFLEHELEKVMKEDKPKIKQIISNDDYLNYRDRAQYKLSINNERLKIGFYKAKSHDVVNVENCYIVRKTINDIIGVIRVILNKEKKKVTLYDEKRHRGYLRHIGIRVNKEGEALVTFVVAKDMVKDYIEIVSNELRHMFPEIKGIVININKMKGNRVFGDKEVVVWGERFIKETINDISFNLGSDTFFQVNSKKLDFMLKFVDKHLKRNSKVLDLYGGVGAMTLPFYKKLKEIVVVEINKKSIDLFDNMVRANEIDNASIVNVDAEKETGKILNDIDPDTVILDPPRKGVHEDVLKALAAAKIKNLIYISCNPITFARDIKYLQDYYHIEEVVPIDLFPQTYHVETMSALKLK